VARTAEPLHDLAWESDGSAAACTVVLPSLFGDAHAFNADAISAGSQREHFVRKNSFMKPSSQDVEKRPENRPTLHS
jgi:hypothetical protein